MGFPTKNVHVGVFLGVPPFKETPIWRNHQLENHFHFFWVVSNSMDVLVTTVLATSRTRKLVEFAGNQRALFPLDLERLLRNGNMAEMEATKTCVKCVVFHI